MSDIKEFRWRDIEKNIPCDIKKFELYIKIYNTVEQREILVIYHKKNKEYISIHNIYWYKINIDKVSDNKMSMKKYLEDINRFSIDKESDIVIKIQDNRFYLNEDTLEISKRKTKHSTPHDNGGGIIIKKPANYTPQKDTKHFKYIRQFVYYFNIGNVLNIYNRCIKKHKFNNRKLNNLNYIAKQEFKSKLDDNIYIYDIVIENKEDSTDKYIIEIYDTHTNKEKNIKNYKKFNGRYREIKIDKIDNDIFKIDSHIKNKFKEGIYFSVEKCKECNKQNIIHLIRLCQKAKYFNILKLTEEETDKLKAKRQAKLEAKLKAEKEYDLSEDEKESEKEINIINWHAVDEDFSRYVIYGFGKDIKGKDYTIKVTHYNPEMYIRIINKNTSNSNDFMENLEKDEPRLNKLLDSINYICSKKLNCEDNKNNNESGKESSSSNDSKKDDYNCCLKHNPHDIFCTPIYTKKEYIIKKYCRIERKKDLYEKFGHNDIIVLKIVFSTQAAFNKLKKLLKHKIISFEGDITKNKYIKIDNILLNKQKNYKIYTYKSDLPPLLDFFHKKDILPCGWIKIKNYKNLNDSNIVDKNKFQIHFKDIEKLDKLEFSPFKIMSWDIEADSSHGDFPLAKKDYKKLAMQITDFYLEYIKINKDEKDDNLFYKMIRYCLLIAFRKDNEITVDLDKKIKTKIKNTISIVYIKTPLSNNHIEKIVNNRFIKNIYYICKKNKIDKVLDIGDSSLDLYLNNNIDNDEYDDNIDEDEYNKDKKKMSNRDIMIAKLNIIFQNEFREVQGDRIIQIGCVFHKFGKKEKNKNYILTLGSCDKFDEDTKIYSFAKSKEFTSYNVEQLDKEETKLIMKFKEIINKEQPNIILGYNTFGFDNKFLYERCEELCIDDTFGYIGKLQSIKTQLTTKHLSSSALGDNILNILPTIGRTEIDLLKLIQRDHNLDSYSLNNVSSVFIGDKKDDVTPKQIFEFQRQTSDKRAIIAKYCIKDCVLLIDLMNKLDKLSANIGMANVCSVPLEFIILRGQGIKVQSLVSKECNIENYILRELEKKSSNSSYEGAIVLPPKKGMYLEDPVAVLDYASLYPSSMIASNISHEVIVKTEFYKNGNLDEIEEINLQNMKDGIHFKHTNKYKLHEGFNIEEYEEEIKSYNRYPLLDSIYIQSLKYRFIKKCKSKLYIAEKFYEDIENKDYDIHKYKLEYDKLSKEEKAKYNTNVYYPYNPKIDNLVENENTDYVNYISISFDTYTGKGDKKEKDGVKKITLAHPCNIEKYDNTDEYPDQTISKRGIMPKILRKLLKARKDTRKKIPLEKDEFKKGVLEGLQLGYKLSANSLYGQTGASTSAIFKQDVAAATTSTGRQMLNLCSSFAVQYYDCDIVYGDTDSCFLKFNSYSEDGVELKDKERLRFGIQKSINLQNEIRTLLRKPHDLEYEKSFFPFILFSKKRYVGYLYEDDWNIVPKLKYMGIVLKRRDNANIVKIIYSGIITRLLEDKTIESAVKFLKEKLEELASGKFPIEDLTVTKTLRGYYKNPEGIAHKVLADRMGERDPGNKPASNDRIPYVYINIKEKKGEKLLQGDRVEHPDYIKENNIKIDYKFYITNQLMKPIMQIFELCMKKPDQPFQETLNKLNRNLMGVKDISSYFN